MDFGKLMEQASRMQESLGRLEDELNATVYEGSSNGLTVKINGKMECLEIHIPEEMMDDREMLEDVLRIAFNQASEKADEDRNSRIRSTAGGLGIPRLR